MSQGVRDPGLPTAERRAHRRAALIAPAMLDGARAYTKAVCRNVSAGGLAVSAAGPLPVGMQLEIYFELPIGYAVETRAEVVRSDGNEIGLRFIDLDQRTQVALRSFCRVSGLHRVALPPVA
jgi:c-di-GMP-binding flagellar brake protein YcgR